TLGTWRSGRRCIRPSTSKRRFRRPRGARRESAEGVHRGCRMDVTNVLQTIARRVGATTTVRSVFGEPIHANGKTVVPVAKVAYGFGGGAGSRKVDAPDRQGEGGGGGGGVRAFPAGALEITEGNTRFVPFIDPAWIGAAFTAGVVLASVFLLRRRRP